MTDSHIHITNHAYERAKDRLSLRQESFDRLAEKAMSEGIKHSDTKGRLNRYLTKLWAQNKQANNIRVYGENVFLFIDTKLVTVFQIPNELRKYLKCL